MVCTVLPYIHTYIHTTTILDATCDMNMHGMVRVEAGLSGLEVGFGS